MSITKADIYYLLVLRPEAERSRLVSVSPEDTALDAARKMEEEKVSSALVVSENNPIGILTEQDFVHRLATRDLSASKTRVKEIMTPGPLQMVYKETRLEDAAKIMREEHIRHLLVRDGSRSVTIISEREMMYAFEVSGWDLEHIITGSLGPRS